MIKIGRKGKITSGRETGRYVLVEDYPETGGYLTLTSDDIDFKQGFDGWVEKEYLDQYIEEAGWVIDRQRSLTKHKQPKKQDS